MNRYLVKVRIVLLELQPFGGVLSVLGGNVSGHSRYTALFLFGALEDDLHPVAFSFLCHNYCVLNKVNESFLLSSPYCSLETVLLDDAHALARNFQCDESLLFL